MKSASKCLIFIFIVFTLTAWTYSLTPNPTTDLIKAFDSGSPKALNLLGNPPFKICNKTRYKLWLADAWGSVHKNPGHIMSSGWWEIKQKECVRVFDDDSGSDGDTDRYIYVVNDASTVTWEGQYEYACVLSGHKFEYTNPLPLYKKPSCPQGWVSVGFMYFGDKDMDLTEK